MHLPHGFFGSTDGVNHQSEFGWFQRESDVWTGNTAGHGKVLFDHTSTKRHGGDGYSDPAWGALQRVDRGNVAGLGRPEYSYVVYKLLGDGPVVGQRMPPEAPLTPDEVALVSDWIAGGAPDN